MLARTGIYLRLYVVAWNSNFAVLDLAGNFARGSAVEAAGGKSQRKIGEGGRGATTQL